MLATGKHFPGHGDTETNSHLRAVDGYREPSATRFGGARAVSRAIGDGVGAIITYHGIIPALDSSGVPAALSPRVLTDLLR